MDGLTVQTLQPRPFILLPSNSVATQTDPTALEPERGRGLLLMRNFMDELVFNDAGNEVLMVKRCADHDGRRVAAGA